MNDEQRSWQAILGMLIVSVAGLAACVAAIWFVLTGDMRRGLWAMGLGAIALVASWVGKLHE